MLRYVLYSIFGISVIGLYGLTTATAADMSSVPTTHGAVPPEYRASGAWRTSPIVWRTGFHGPAAYVPPTVDTGSSGSSGSGGGGVGFYGGFGGGK